MADIPIQHKTGRSIWPWLIVLVALALLLWLFMGRNRDEQRGRSATAVDTTQAATTPAGDTTGRATPTP